MKMLVIGLEGAAPSLLFGDERLENVQRLMQLGCYGPLRSKMRAEGGAGWDSLSSNQDAGSLGKSRVAGATGSVSGVTIWDQFATRGKQVILLGETSPNGQAYRGPDPDSIPALVAEKSQERFAHLRQLMETTAWDCIHFVDTSLDQLQRIFAEFENADPVRNSSDSLHQSVLRNYYLYLDRELAQVLELLSDDTVILILSTHNAERLSGNNSNQSGCFILTASNNPLHGELPGVNLLDMAPTLLELAGDAIPSSIQGQSLVSGIQLVSPGYTVSDEEIIRERLEGLGYI